MGAQGQGDWVRVLLDAVQPELDKDTSDISQYTLQVRVRAGRCGLRRRSAEQGIPALRHRWPRPACWLVCIVQQHVASDSEHSAIGCVRTQGHLDAALRSSSAAGEDPDVLRRVDVRMPQTSKCEFAGVSPPTA